MPGLRQIRQLARSRRTVNLLNLLTRPTGTGCDEGDIARLRSTGDHDIQSRDHGCVKEIGHLHTDGSELDKAFQ